MTSRNKWTLREAVLFYEKYGCFPLELRMRGGEGDVPDPDEDKSKKPITFESQADLDKIINKRLASAERSWETKRGQELRSELAEEIKQQLAADAKRKTAADQGEYQKLHEQVINALPGAIPDDSPLGQVIKRLKTGHDDLADAVDGLIEEQTKALPEEMQDLVPEDLDPAATLKWITKALAKENGKDKDGNPIDKKKPLDKKPGHGIRNPKPRGSGGTTVDEIVKDMRGISSYRRI